MISIFKLIRGYLIITINGPMLERFMTQCVRRHFLLWNIIRKDETITLCVSRNAFGEFKDLARQTQTKISIERRCGLPYLLYRHRKRRIFMVCSLCAIIVLYVMSMFVWDIHVIGKESYSKNEIIHYVSKHYVHGGQRISTVNTIVLEEELRTHFDKFAWVSCEIKGTQLIIHIKETVPISKVRKCKAPCDLIANKEGIITSIVTRSGTPVVKQEQKVKKGDILISGIISYQNDNKEVYKKAAVAADGDVICQTVYPYHDEFFLNYYTKKPLDEHYDSFRLLFFKHNIWLYKAKKPVKEYDIVKKEYKLKLGNTFYLPMKLTRIRYQPYTLVRKTYNYEQANKEAKRHLQEYYNKLSKKGVQIKQNNVTIRRQSDKMICSGIITVLEPIGKVSLIDKKQIQKESKDENNRKKNGDS